MSRRSDVSQRFISGFGGGGLKESEGAERMGLWGRSVCPREAHCYVLHRRCPLDKASELEDLHMKAFLPLFKKTF